MVLFVFVFIIYYKVIFCKYLLFLRMIRMDLVIGVFGLKIIFKLISILNVKLIKKIILKCFNLILDNYI